jgi:hypothetical protein
VTATPLKPHDELSLAAARLSRAAPNGWDDFLRAMKTYSDWKSADVVAATPADIFTAQGRARQCTDLLKLFEDAIQRAKSLTK